MRNNNIILWIRDKKRMSTILMVDDNQDNLDVLSILLLSHGYKIHAARQGETALKLLQETKVDLILLDICMPGMDGYEVCQRLKNSSDTKDIPVIFISAFDAYSDKIKGFEAGGVDYICKPFNCEEVLSRIATHVKFYHLQQQQRLYAQELEIQVNLKTAELRRSNEALRAANIGLEKALQVKNDFLMLMNHELRTPLNGVLGMAQLLKTGLPPEKLEYLKILEDSGWHLLKLIDNLLRVSKESLNMESIENKSNMLDIKAVCGESISMIAALALEKNIHTHLDIKDVSIVETALDSARLHQILANLLDNAVKFTPAGGNIGLSVYHNETTLLIDVWDTGSGIPENERENIFNAFVQREPVHTRCYQGLGLGLTLARNLVRLHGGYIDVFSHSSGGSIFRVNINAKSIISPQQQRQCALLSSQTDSILERLSPEQCQILCKLIDLGDINAIHEFAQDLAAQGCCPELVKKLITFSEEFNLNAIRALV
jgi:two-component system, sensor histidine kinase and response regulator